MAKSGALFITILFLFIGCASTKVHFIGKERYKPSSAVEILTSRPDRAYLEIALIEAKAPKYANGNFVFEKMRSKAQKIGADALIPFEYDEIPELMPSRESPITVGPRKPGTVDILSQNLGRQPKVWAKALAIIFSGFAHPAGLADSTETEAVKQNNVDFMLLPIVFSSPDTRLAFGVLPQLVFRTPTSSNPSSIRMDTYYTLNKQYHILLRPTLWLSDDSWNLSGKFSFKKWPTSFYGIGNSTEEEEQEKFTETLYESSLEAATRMGSHYYAGLEYALRYSRITLFDVNGRLASGDITGSSDHLVSSLGVLLRKDTRDNHFFPSKGSYHTLSAASSIKAIGSDFSYTRFKLDLRKYLSLSRQSSHVLALQGMVSVATGTLPFRSLASVGSTLRGYSSVRYIDRNQMAFQAEYRFVPIWRRLGATIFAGAGDVFNRVDDLHLDRIKFSVGFGIRYLFSRSEKINIRLDYGFGKESSGDYLDLNEAF